MLPMVFLILLIFILLVILSNPAIEVRILFKERKAHLIFNALFFGFIRIPLRREKAGRKASIKEGPQNKKEKRSAALTKILFSKEIRNILTKLKGAVSVDLFYFKVEFGTGDAFWTALLNGIIWSMVSEILAYLDANYHVEKHKIEVVPDFNRTQFNACLHCILSVLHANTIYLGIYFLLKYVFRYKYKLGGEKLG